MITTGTTPAAAPSTTGTISIGGGDGLEASVVEASAVEVSTVPARRPDPQRRQPGCTRIRGTPRPERRKIGSLQRLRSRRRGKRLFLAWKLQLRRRCGFGVAAVVSVAADSAVDMAAVATDRRTTQMRQTKFRELYWVRLASAAILVAACLPQRSVAQQPGQKTFSSPQDASKALVAAAESNDEKAMLEILGPDGQEVISSGDKAEDAQDRADFIRRYQEMHRLVKEPDGFTLYVGAENWPVPIPVVEQRSLLVFRHCGRQERNFVPANRPE